MQNLISAVERIDPLTVSGRVAAVKGLLIEARGGLTRLSVGARADIIRAGEAPLPAEVVGFRDTRALLMPSHRPRVVCATLAQGASPAGRWA
jgi:flagellum-specific ATP synthase